MVKKFVTLNKSFDIFCECSKRSEEDYKHIAEINESLFKPLNFELNLILNQFNKTQLTKQPHFIKIYELLAKIPEKLSS